MNNGETETVLGRTVKDKITGFAGVVLGRCEYITGCNQVLVQPPLDRDGNWVESHWFDEDRVEPTDAPKVKIGFTSPGFDKPAPRC
jgi:hypothetical protein